MVSDISEFDKHWGAGDWWQWRDCFYYPKRHFDYSKINPLGYVSPETIETKITFPISAKNRQYYVIAQIITDEELIIYSAEKIEFKKNTYKNSNQIKKML